MITKILLYILSASALLYFLVIITFTIGWYRMKPFTASVRNFSTKISVVVAFRNESGHLEDLLNSLYQQTYPKDLWEIILVNDHSEDESLRIIGQFISRHKRMEITVVDSPGTGKKKALLEGVKKATGSLIASTDADCLAGKNWLVKLASFYEQEHPLLIFGPVVYDKEENYLQHFFSLDFLSLVASGAGSAASNLPLMGNGANLAFEKDIFLESGAESQKQQYASGDDVFLIHYLTRKYGSNTVQFIKNKESIVRTQTPKTIKEFMVQRTRWGSKAKAYDQPWPLLVAITILVFNSLLVLSFLSGLLLPWVFSIYLLFIFFKFLIDLPLLQAYGGFSNKSKLLIYLLPFEFIYPFYIVTAAIKGLFPPYEWKGRKSK